MTKVEVDFRDCFSDSHKMERSCAIILPECPTNNGRR